MVRSDVVLPDSSNPPGISSHWGSHGWSEVTTTCGYVLISSSVGYQLVKNIVDPCDRNGITSLLPGIVMPIDLAGSMSYGLSKTSIP